MPNPKFGLWGWSSSLHCPTLILSRSAHPPLILSWHHFVNKSTFIPWFHHYIHVFIIKKNFSWGQVIMGVVILEFQNHANHLGREGFILNVTCSIFRVPVFMGGLTIKWWWLCTGMWVPLILTIIILWVYLLLIFRKYWFSWTWGVKVFTFVRLYPPLFAQRIAAMLMAAHEMVGRWVMCWLKHGIYFACNISCVYLGATKMSSLDADKETELIEPNFKQCMLNFLGWPTWWPTFWG